MRTLNSHAQDDRWPQPSLPEAIPVVRCCIVVTCRNADAVSLGGDVCAEHGELTFGKAASGVWAAWLLLCPGTHHGVIEARCGQSDDLLTNRPATMVRRHFALTIPPLVGLENSVPQLWLVREHGERLKDRFRDG